MARYDVVIDLQTKHVIAVEAEDPDEARGKALDLAGSRSPESTFMTIDVQRGVN